MSGGGPGTRVRRVLHTARVVASFLAAFLIALVPAIPPLAQNLLREAAALPVGPATAQAATASGSAASNLPAATNDSRLTVTSRPSAIAVARPNSPVTYTYRVTNNTDSPAYQVSLTDDRCGPITGGTGTENDGYRWWIPPRGTATYSCAGEVDGTRTNTVTAVFDFVADDGTRSRATSTASSTVTVGGACDQLWYSTRLHTAANRGTIGTVTFDESSDVSALNSRVTTADLGPYAGRPFPRLDYLRALGVDPVSGDIFFIPSGGLATTNDGVWRVSPDGTGNIRVIGSTGGILMGGNVTYSDRLTVGPDGSVWSWARDQHLYRLEPGAEKWTDYGVPPGPWSGTTQYAGWGDLTFDGAGNLYLLGRVGDTAHSQYIGIVQAADLDKLTPRSPVTVINLTPSSDYGYVGFAFGPDGALYGAAAATTGRNDLDRIDLSTGIGTQVYTDAGIPEIGYFADLGSCVLPKGSLTAVKAADIADTDRDTALGRDVIDYTITVRNTGNAPVVDATLFDTLPEFTSYVPGSTRLNGEAVPDVNGEMPFGDERNPRAIRSAGAGTDGLVVAGGTATLTFQVRVDANIAAQNEDEIVNQATIASSAGVVLTQDPARPASRSDKPDPTLVPVAEPGVLLEMKASTAEVKDAQTVTYTYTVTNTGSEPLKDVTLTDEVTTDRENGGPAPLPDAACASPRLLPGGDKNGNGLLDPKETWEYACEQPLVWKPGDKLPFTTVTNNATVTAVAVVSGEKVEGTAEASVIVYPKQPEVEVIKAAGEVSGPDPATGEYTATYTVTVQNNGQLPTKYGPLTDTPAFPEGLKIVGASWTGPTSGAATGSAEGPGPFALVEGVEEQNLGGKTTHTYRVTVRFAATTDRRETEAFAPCGSVPKPGEGLYNAVTLPPGQEHLGTDNNVTCLAPPEPPRAELALTQRAGLPVDTDGDGVIDAGDSLPYSFTVTNTGTLTATGVTVADELLATQGIEVTCTDTTLPPGDSTVCRSATPYVLTQADIDSGAVTNTATATAQVPGLPEVTSDEATTTTPLLRTPTLGLAKHATVTDATKDGVTNPGDTIDYRFTVTNRGNVTLTDVAVSDPLLSQAGTTVQCEATTLAPGENTECTASAPYTITDADQTAGTVTNHATATAQGPESRQATTEASTTVPVAPTGRLMVTKAPGVVSSVDPTSGRATVGYNVTVSNVGGSPISYGALTDTPAFASQLAIDSASWTGPTSGSAQGGGPYTLAEGGRLAQGSSHTYAVTVTYHYTGPGVATDPVPPCAATPTPETGLYNAAALAKDPARPQDPEPNLARAVTCAEPPDAPTTGLTLVKSVLATTDTDGNNRTNAGDSLTYRFAVTNTGSTVVTGLAIDDELLREAGVGITCPTDTLAPGGTTTCTSGAYTVTTADQDSGAVTNTATARANTPGLGPVESEPSGTSTELSLAALSLNKIAGDVTDANASGRQDAGDTVEYRFEVANTGTVDLTDVVISDPRLAGSQTCTVPALAAGTSDTSTCRLTYTLTQADLDKPGGTLVNTATATATPADGGAAPHASATAQLPLTPAAGALTVVKSHGGVTDANGTGRNDAGDTLTYHFTVTNTGAQTLKNPVIDDERIGVSGLACGTTALAPGATTSCSATYELGQTDFDTGGRLENTATARATGPDGTEVTGVSEPITKDLNAAAHLSADIAGPTEHPDARAGDTITYPVTVTNDGNQTVTGVAITTPEAATTTCPTTTDVLSPGRSITCAVTYPLTQEDVDSGQLTHTVKVTSTNPVTDTSDVITTTLSGTASLALDKAVVPVDGKNVVDTDGNGTDLGDTISYRFTVTNTGTTTLSPVTITDAKLGLKDMVCASVLPPDETVTCTPPEPYSLTQPDVDANSITNEATARGTTHLGVQATPGTDSVTVTYDPPVHPASLALEKVPGEVTDANGTGRQDAGDTVAYTFNVTNTGPLTVRDVTINDPLLGASFTCGSGEVAPQTTLSCVSPEPYRLTQADVDAGQVDNTATVTAVDPHGRAVTQGQLSDNATVKLAPSAAVELQKIASAVDDLDGNGPDAGDQITYTFRARNTGALTLEKLTLSDPTVGLEDVPCAASVAPGAEVVCDATRTYTLTQSDVDNRRIDNTATLTAVTAALPGGAPAQTVQSADSDSVPLANVAGIELTKRSGDIQDLDGNGNDAGDQVPYVFEVRNPSNVTLTDVTVTDPKLTGVTCESTRLVPGATTVCESEPYTLTQVDVDAGRVDNTARVTAIGPGGGTVTAEDSDTKTFTAAAGVSLTKEMTGSDDANGNGVVDPGDTLTYTLTVTNTGAVTLLRYPVNDPTLRGMECQTGTIAPGEHRTCTGTYTVTDDDQRAGEHVNTARVEAVAAGNRPLSDTATATTPVASAADVDVVNTAGTVTPVDASGRGTASYTVRVVNSGGVPAPYTLTDTAAYPANVVIDGVSWSGPTSGDAAGAGPWTLATDATVPGETTHEYVVTVRYRYTGPAPAEGPGTLTTTAALAAGQEHGPVANNFAAPAPPGAPSTGLTLRKQVAGTADLDGDGRVSAGDRVTYEFTARNTGTLQLTDVAVSDPLLDGLGGAGAVSCAATTLAPGASTTCTAPAYTVSAADVEAGGITNTATASATAPEGWTGEAPSAEGTATLPVTTAGLTLEKTHAAPADANRTGRVDAGDTVAYSFTVTNTGTSTLTNVQVNDPRLGIAPFPCAASLAAGASATCEAPASYVLTQSDVDAGEVVNEATATGTPADGGAAPVAGDTDTLTLDGLTSSVALAKTSGGIVDANGSGGADAGDTVTYTFTVTNTGATTLTSPVVTDSLLGWTDQPCGTGPLAPGDAAVCAGVYTLAQGDVDANAVANTASAAATGPDAVPTTPATASTVTPLDALAALSLEKTGPEKLDNAAVGNTVTYSFTVTNTGAATVSDVRVADPLLGTAAVKGCPTSLYPGASGSCTATYPLTQADVDRGSLTNTATVTGTRTTTGEAGQPVVRPVPSDTATWTVALTAQAGLTVTGEAGDLVDTAVEGASAGDQVPFTLTVTNSGGTTLTDVRVSDLLLGEFLCTAGPLAPGASAECVRVHTLTQAEVDAGSVTATPTVTATAPSGPVEATTEVPFTLTTGAPSVEFVKEAGALADTNGNGRADAGESIPFTFTVRNTGPVTLSAATIDDPRAGGTVTCAENLAPGNSATCRAAAPYVIQQADLERGAVVNTAVLTPTWANGATTDPVTAEKTVELSVANSLTLSKTSDGVQTGTDGRADAGDRVPYSFTVRNTGQQTLTDVRIVDAALGTGTQGVACAATLAPGAEVTCVTGTTAGLDSRVLTQDDVNAGRVDNTATVTATAPTTATNPDGATVTASDAASVSLDQVGNLTTATAISDPGTTPAAGDEVTVSVTIRNDGNVTLTDLTGSVRLPDGTTTDCKPLDELAPGTSSTCQITYPLTQADVDRGSLGVTVTTSGTDPSGAGQTATASASQELAATASVSLDKYPVDAAGEAVEPGEAVSDANGDGRVSAGDTIGYRFKVTNTGTATLSAVTVADTMLGLDGFACGTGTLAPGAAAECGPVTATVTQAQIDAGLVHNTATASATTLLGEHVPAASDAVDVPLTPANGFTLTKRASSVLDANASGRADAGDRIDYTFTVTNTGSQTLTDVTVHDDRLGVPEFVCVPSLAPGASATCAAPAAYVLAQDDVNAGSVVNTASATATAPGGPAGGVTADSEATTTTSIEALASLTVLASGGAVHDTDGNGHSAGDTVTWTYRVTNTSNVTVTDVTVDATVGDVGVPVTCEPGTLAPGETAACTTAPVPLTQQQIDAGRVEATGTARATAPGVGTVTSDPAVANVPLTPTTDVAVTTTPACSAGGSPTDTCGVSAQVTHTFTVTNTGATTLDSVTIEDPLLGTVTVSGPIALGASVTQAAPPVTVTQEDVDRGSLTTASTVTTTAGQVQVTGATGSDLPLAGEAGLEFTKTVRSIRDTDASRSYTAGDQVTFTFEATNTGTVTLPSVTVTDEKLSLNGYPCAGPIAPGQTVSCASPLYPLTTADLDSGALENTATATALPARGEPVTDTGSVSVPLTDFPSLTLVKTAEVTTDANGDGMAGRGDAVTYRFTVTNNSERSVSDLRVTDALLASRGLLVVCDDTKIEGGGSVDCAASGELTVTDTDLTARSLDNRASAEARTAAGNLTPVAHAGVSTPLAVPQLDLTKSGQLVRDGITPGVADEGDTVRYTFTVHNPGTVTVSEIAVRDTLLERAGIGVTCEATELAPGGSTLCTADAPRTVQADDLGDGVVHNVATAVGTASSGESVTSNVADARLTAGQQAHTELAVTLVAGRDPNREGNALAAGEQLTFSVTVINVGNVPLSAVTVSDTLGAGPFVCEDATLAPGESTVCTAPPYTVTEADAAAQQVTNTATATATPLHGGQVSATAADSVTVPAELPDLALTKRGEITLDKGFPGLADPGDQVTYRFTVTNRGNATVNVQIDDPMFEGTDPVTCDNNRLAPGESSECVSVPYTIPAGQPQGAGVTALRNVAVATGSTEHGNIVDEGADTTTPVAPVPDPQVGFDMGYQVQDTNGNGQLEAGEGVLFDYVVTNTGNVPLVDVAVHDPRVTGSGHEVRCDSTTLAPDASTGCQATGPYIVTADDVANGVLVNVVRVTAGSTYNFAAPAPSEDQVTIALAHAIVGPGPSRPTKPGTDPTEPGTADPTDPTQPVTPPGTDPGAPGITDPDTGPTPPGGATPTPDGTRPGTPALVRPITPGVTPGGTAPDRWITGRDHTWSPGYLPPTSPGTHTHGWWDAPAQGDGCLYRTPTAQCPSGYRNTEGCCCTPPWVGGGTTNNGGTYSDWYGGSHDWNPYSGPSHNGAAPTAPDTSDRTIEAAPEEAPATGPIGSCERGPVPLLGQGVIGLWPWLLFTLLILGGLLRAWLKRRRSEQDDTASDSNAPVESPSDLE